MRIFRFGIIPLEIIYYLCPWYVYTKGDEI